MYQAITGPITYHTGAGGQDRLNKWRGLLEFELARLPLSSLPRVMLTSPSIPPLTAVVYSYKVHVFVATFQRAFDSNIPPPFLFRPRAR